MKKKGITLIALIITIIVLLILAGVSIALVIGDNGIVTKSMQSKENTRGASVDERLHLTVTENTLTGANEHKITKNELVQKLYTENLLTEDEYNKLSGLNNETEIDIITIGDFTIDFSILKENVITIGEMYSDSWIGKKINYNSLNNNDIIQNDEGWIVIGKIENENGNNDVLITTAVPSGSQTIEYNIEEWCDYEDTINNACRDYVGETGTLGDKAIDIKEVRGMTKDDVNNAIGFEIPETFEEYTFCQTQDYDNQLVNYCFPNEETKEWVRPLTSGTTWKHLSDWYEFKYYNNNYYYASNTTQGDSHPISYNNLPKRENLNYIVANGEFYWIASKGVNIADYAAYYNVFTIQEEFGIKGLMEFNLDTSNSELNTDDQNYEIDGCLRPVAVISSETPFEYAELGEYMTYSPMYD